MSDNEELYEAAMDAIRELYSDTTVSKEKCKSNMRSLIEEIRAMIQAL